MPDRITRPSSWATYLLFSGLFSLTSTVTMATENTVGYDQVTLSVSAEGTVSREIVIATLAARSEGPNLETATGEVNRSIRNALEKAKRVAEVKAQTLDYQTVPTFQDQKPSGWLVQQSIRIESRQPDKLASLLGELQKTLKLESMDYQVTPETRKSVEDRLILDALKAFQNRAELITHGFGRNRYRLVKLEISGETSPRRMSHVMARTQSAETATTPSLEPGEAPLSITVQGTVELQPN